MRNGEALGFVVFSRFTNIFRSITTLTTIDALHFYFYAPNKLLLYKIIKQWTKLNYKLQESPLSGAQGSVNNWIFQRWCRSFHSGASSHLLWACAAGGATRWGSPTAAQTPSGTWGLRWGSWGRHFPVQRQKRKMKKLKGEDFAVHFCHLVVHLGIAAEWHEKVKKAWQKNVF